jgi:hypothetical protein
LKKKAFPLILSLTKPMVRANAMHVFTATFANGDKVSLLAPDSTIARLTAQELGPDSAIVAVHKIDQWSDNHD